ncbi:hypothetical protein [Polaribacter porphyrae]|nr:hypothetical protein [Polaribacter porphyrae]
MIYKAISVLDKVNIIKKRGIRKRGKVLKIRKEVNSYYDEDGGTSILYYYTVSFKTNRGKLIEKEIEFGVKKKPNRNPPFDVDIIYFEDEKNNLNVILENNKSTIFDGFFLLFVGIFFLCILIYNYDGELDIIISFIKNLIK